MAQFKKMQVGFLNGKLDDGEELEWRSEVKNIS